MERSDRVFRGRRLTPEEIRRRVQDEQIERIVQWIKESPIGKSFAG